VPDLIVVGDVMVDVSVAAGELARGGDIHGEVRIRPGGTATNAAAWGAWAGASVRVHGRVGADVAGRMVTEALRERGIDPAMAVDDEAPTGSMLVVHQTGERSMVADRGANAHLAEDDLPDRLAAGAVLVSGYLLFHPGSEPAARAALARADAPLVAIDAASWPLVRDYGAGAFLEAAGPATVLLANGAEAEALTGRSDREAAARHLSPSFARVVIKDGSKGAVLAGGGDLLRLAADPVEEINPTGAGDAFDGVLLAHLARGTDDREALALACAAGAGGAGGGE
jgi:sugar/nucleoside kinase (ribokinase family)